MITLYHPELDLATSICDDLPEQERKHLRSLRVGIGEAIRLVNGRGSALEGVLTDFSAHKCAIGDLVHVSAFEPNGERIMVIGKITESKLEWAIEALTPLGMTQLWVVNSEYSQPVTLRHDRLERIAIAAMKQCRRSLLPTIHLGSSDSGVSLPQLFAAIGPHNSNYHRFLADCDGSPIGSIGKINHSDSIFAIGPEGGFTTSEISSFVDEGFKKISFGDRILRAELAATVALATLL